MTFWPFNLIFGMRRQRQQREASLQNIVESAHRQRHAAKAENDLEATRAIMAAEHRIRQGRPLRDMLDGMISRQRDEMAKDSR